MSEIEMTPWGTERVITKNERVKSIPDTGPKPWDGHVASSPEEQARIEKEYQAKHG